MSDRLEIVPLTKPPRATVRVPGSKSITNRALVLAAITAWGQPCHLRGALRSEDTEVMIEALTKLGFKIETQWEMDPPTVIVGPSPQPEGSYPPFPADVYVVNSGTTMRFLTALVTLGKGQFRIDGNERMRERPIEDLLDALRQVGVIARSERSNGCPPVIIESDRFWKGEHLKVRGGTSSQFLTALLMIAPLAVPDTGTFLIELDGPLVSEPYVKMTISMMEHWGLLVERKGKDFETCHAGAHGTFREQDHYTIEPDASAASYFFAAAAITGGRVGVRHLTPDGLQGDVRFVNVLERMGCALTRSPGELVVQGKPLRGIDVDMNDISDTVMTLGAVACFAEGPTTIRNVAHIRHKETDRLAALAAELRRVGAEVEEFADGLTITPRPLHGAEIETYNDHRMAMSMALIGLRVPGIVIKNPGCVAKTYPHFFTDLERLRTESPEDKS
jgi:3-phosphoshikimate 1-carboxyvinyltransferase